MKTYVFAGILCVAVFAFGQSQVRVNIGQQYELASITAGGVSTESTGANQVEISYATICYFTRDGCKREDVRISRDPAQGASAGMPNAEMAAAMKLEFGGWEFVSTAYNGSSVVLFFRHYR
jgi:hypothetical protein